MKLENILQSPFRVEGARDPGTDVLKWLGEKYGSDSPIIGVAGGVWKERVLDNAPEMVRQLKTMRPDVQRAVMTRLIELLDGSTDASRSRSLALSKELGVVNNIDIPNGNVLHDYARELGLQPSWAKRTDILSGWRP